ncbi:hypothetical protein LX16_0204 [Stackebrandtia albiflava]|uniref:Uncharacterized protein n=1 Tax=Stackebrandtia albiflava TaxID=406432 RepID=A0A562V9F4_9ACTN|nr:hypothetical protein [Stackebrandtia albiflava]TWJ14519.1 hypothetical protein LX16_0204 [Stackebrandtia albiflava]
MNSLLLSVHVLAGIVFVGGSAVATSLFPRYAPVSGEDGSEERDTAVAALLHRITGGYALCGVVVPVVGMVLATVQGRMGEIWVVVAMVLTGVAAVLLAAQIHPRQRTALWEPGTVRDLRTLAMLAGFYNLIWAAVVVLMIVRPGYEVAA